ncbi:MAG: flavodoxin-dependent (E)-4-hydroxy-3-methylbut-2-enyl-diphosphate synthase [Candidatus Omnitrophota bacterium]|nr:MAG: flavodoxin-dependent (E)-4-hydroxy-3-methylbut-2-enyl-diphosphate synthase [Candidatus Omnitrophota bacterium]
MTRTVKIGDVKVGGRFPVRIQGMLKGNLKDKSSVLREAKRLQQEGAEVLRVAVKEAGDVALLNHLRKQVHIPLVADIHFRYKLALQAIEAGFDGIRLNPLNIHKRAQVREVVRQAKIAKVSIRVGVNAGGFKRKFANEQVLAKEMVTSGERFIRILEREDFFDTIVSMKASTVRATILANRIFSQRFNYPLHLGVTASGPFLEAVVKSSMGIGALLQEGIGSIIRVSLTAPSFWEIRVAKFIMQALGVRQFFPEIISCPTCSRCQVDLIHIVNSFQKEMLRLHQKGYAFPEKIALMGCEVNGPGEAQQADIGVAFGKRRGVIFQKGTIVGTLSEKNSVREFIDKVKMKPRCMERSKCS